MIVVLNTNILARGAISRASAVSAIMDAWRANTFTLAVSTHILTEVDRALRKPYFTQRLSAQDRATYQGLLGTYATLVPVTAVVHGVATHPEDDLILATAISAGADYLVTRDRQLLRLLVPGGDGLKPHGIPATVAAVRRLFPSTSSPRSNPILDGTAEQGESGRQLAA